MQDSSATPGPCTRTAHRHTLLGTHWRTCGVRTRTWERENVHRAWHVAPKQPILESSRLRRLGCPSADGLSMLTIYDNQPAKAGDRHWVGQTVAAFHWSRHLVSGVAGLSASSSSKADTVNICCKKLRDVTGTLDNNWDNKHVVSCCYFIKMCCYRSRLVFIVAIKTLTSHKVVV